MTATPETLQATPAAPERPATATILVAILAAAVFLRLAPIGWGLPLSRYSGFYHPDEHRVYWSVAGFPGNYLRNDDFLYGTAFQYAVGALLLPLKRVATLLPAVSSRYILLVAIACRLASVAMGTLAVYLGFRVGRRLFGETAGMLTAAFMSVSLYLTLNSAFATLDVTIACLVMLNLLLCLRAAEEPSVRAVMLAGFGAGLLFATKISTLTFIIFPAALGAVTPRLRQVRLALAYLAVAAAVFAISTPQVPLHMGEYLLFMRTQKAEWLDRNPTTVPHMLVAWWTQASRVIGVPILALGIIGTGAPWSGRRVIEAALLAFAAAYLAFFQGFLQPRFLVPVAPIACLFAAAGAASLLSQRSRVVRTASCGMVVFALGHSLVRTLGGIYMRFTDTRTVAAREIDRLAPAGASIAYADQTREYERRHIRWMMPPVDSTKYRIVSLFDHPDFIVTSSDAYQPIGQLLRSGRLQPGYIVTVADRQQWFRSVPPEPRRLAMFDCLLHSPSQGYELVAQVWRSMDIPVDMDGHAVRIFRRATGARVTTCAGDSIAEETYQR